MKQWMFLVTLPLMYGQTEKADEVVELEVYSDFECPFCAQFAKPLEQFREKGVEGVQTKVTFKNFPLSFHQDAQLAAQAGQAAAAQGKFWEMHDLIFSNRTKIKRDDLLGYAEKLGLDMDRFRADLDDERLKNQIFDDIAEGTKRGVDGTPTFFINGKAYSGMHSYEQLSELVGGERRRKRALEEIGAKLLSKGPEEAPITLEFFADLTSPVSVPAVSVLDEVMKKYPSTLRLQFRNFPLAFHPQAPLAHEAAMDAAREGRFWEVADYILQNQESLREQDLIAFAGKMGLDAEKFAQTLQAKRYTPRVEADVMEGLNRGIRGSPVIFVNSKRIDGVPSLTALTELVEEELKAKQ